MERESVNDELREYKRQIDHEYKIGVAQITNNEVVKVKIIEFEEPEEVVTIPTFDIDEKEYQKYLVARRKKEFERFKKGDERWKNQLLKKQKMF